MEITQDKMNYIQNQSMASSRSFHVMAKPIGPLCNLDCKYCLYLEKERDLAMKRNTEGRGGLGRNEPCPCGSGKNLRRAVVRLTPVLGPLA